MHFTAFVPDVDVPAAGNLTVRRSHRWPTQRPMARIAWEQTALSLWSRRLGLDLLHATVNVSPWFAGCPAVVTVPDLSFLRYPEAFPPFQRLYLRTQTRRSVHAARRVIAISAATQRDVVELLDVPAERVDVVHVGIDETFSPAPAGQVEAFRRQKGLPPRFILYVGTLEPRKNLVRLVQAFQQVKARPEHGDRAGANQDLKLVLGGGEGWYYQDIFDEVARLDLEGEVMFPGYVPNQELAWWYRAAAVFAYPSLMEGFGLPVGEALACGTPVVTSDLSSLPEVAGDAALLVDPTSVDSMADALHRLLVDDDLARELSARGPQQAARFTWHRTALETVAVYRQALVSPRSAAWPAATPQARIDR
jgi:glycosyltransferase involved in cell wall biosynthesis